MIIIDIGIKVMAVLNIPTPMHFMIIITMIVDRINLVLNLMSWILIIIFILFNFIDRKSVV